MISGAGSHLSTEEHEEPRDTRTPESIITMDNEVQFFLFQTKGELQNASMELKKIAMQDLKIHVEC